MEEFVVYILSSKAVDGKIYIGYTSDLINRIRSHNVFSKKGYTIRYRPWQVIYVAFFSNRKPWNGKDILNPEWGEILSKTLLLSAGFISAKGGPEFIRPGGPATKEAQKASFFVSCRKTLHS